MNINSFASQKIVPIVLPADFTDFAFFKIYFVWCCPIFRLFLRLGCVKMDPSSLPVINRRRDSLRMRRESAKPDIESVTRLRLFATVNKYGTHLADSFYIHNFSWKIVITVPCDMPKASIIYRTLTRRSFKIIPWTFSEIPSVIASTRRPERGFSRVDIRLPLFLSVCCLSNRSI